MASIKKDELIEVAKELNGVMGLDPAIDVKKNSKILQQGIMQAGEFVDPQEDEFSEKTWIILEQLEVAYRPAQGPTPDRSEEGLEEGQEESQEEQTESVSEETEKSEDKGVPVEESVTIQDEQETDAESTSKEEVETKDAYVENEKQSKSAKSNASKSSSLEKLSNKARVYQAWQDNETNTENLCALVNNVIKKTTIKCWMNQWKNGKNLPAIAKASE